MNMRTRIRIMSVCIHNTTYWSQYGSGSIFSSRVADPKLFLSDPDPDPTKRVISDPDLAHGSFRIWILVCEIFVKFSNKSECTFKGHFCAEIKLFMLKI